jgi:hypothetical protein
MVLDLVVAFQVYRHIAPQSVEGRFHSIPKPYLATVMLV